MSDSPLEMTPEREQRIRERAYHLWEADGSPHGRDLEYWERARELVGMEESAGAGLIPNPQTHPAPNEVAPGSKVEEAEIQENYGEFPGRMTDQGDWEQTPEPRKGRRKPEALVNEQPTRGDAP